MRNIQGNGITVRERDILTFGILAVSSVAFLIWVIPVFTPPYPGYGVSAALLPNVVVGLILALSVLSLVRNLLAYRAERMAGAPLEESQAKDKVHLGHLAFFMIPCFLMMTAMKWIGFIPAGIVFMLFIQFLCGQRKPIQAVIVAVATVGIIYAAMRYGLGVPIP